MTFVEDLAKVLKVHDVLADPYRPAVGAIMPFYRDAGGFTREQLASTALRILIEAGGNVNRFYFTHYGYQARLGQAPIFPSPETLRGATIIPPSERGSLIKHDVHKQDQRHGLVFMGQFRRFVEDTGLRSGQYYVTLDGSPTVKYGEKIYESKRALSDLSEVALYSRPIYRRKGDKVHPFFRGATGGLEFLHCAGHVTKTKETQTLYVDASPKFSLPRATRNCMEALAQAPCTPEWIGVDKEFTGRGDVWEELRNYADRKEILVVGPKVRDDTVKDELQRLWDDQLFEATKYAGSRMWWTFTERDWSESAKGYRPYGMLTAFEQVPYGFKPDEQHGMIVNEGSPGKSPRVAAFPIQINKRITTESQFKRVLGCIPRRWACEDLFQRHEMRFARAKSRDLFPKQLYYNLSLGALNSYGHWRAIKQATLTHPNDDATSMSWWIGDLQACMDRPDTIGQLPALKPKRRKKKDSVMDPEDEEGHPE